MALPVDLHPALASLVRAQGLPETAVRSDGRLTLVIDRQYRVHVSPAADGRLAVHARLVAPEAGLANPRNEGLIDKLLTAAQALVATHRSGLVAAPQGDALLLQQWVPAAATLETLQTALAEFVNALAFWAKTAKSL
jgi:hypothetical protein